MRGICSQDIIRQRPIFLRMKKHASVPRLQEKGRAKTTLVHGAEVHCYAQRTTTLEGDATTGPVASETFEHGNDP